MADESVSLKEYFDRLLSDHAVSHQEHQAAHDREHSLAQKAIDTAAELAKENKADANEWRDAMSDRERTFARADAIEQLSKDVYRRLGLLEKQANQANGALNVARFVGFGGFITGLGAIVWVTLQTT